jgi:hypothetical protein
MQQQKKGYSVWVALVLGVTIIGLPIWGNAQEVDKGKIPAEHLATTCKVVPWGSPVWDVEEAMVPLNAKEKILWVDTRPEVFGKKGTVRGSVILVYDKAGSSENILTKEKLEEALKAAGLPKETAKVVFFCQGPECHRSYNAAYMAVKEWGFDPKNVIWFRAGYPLLFKAIKDDPKLQRKAASYITDEGVGNL